MNGAARPLQRLLWRMKQATYRCFTHNVRERIEPILACAAIKITYKTTSLVGSFYCTLGEEATAQRRLAALSAFRALLKA